MELVILDSKRESKILYLIESLWDGFNLLKF